MKAYQRVSRVAGNSLLTKEVLEAGFHSAIAIADLTLDEFVHATVLNLADAYPIHEIAQDHAIDAGLQFTAIRDHLQLVGEGNRHPLTSVNATAATRSYLQKLDGFEKLFGRQASCKCRHCQSVLNPAAYFVDLMRFLDKHVTAAVFTGNKANHELKLQNRRPDLWRLELTCENTTRLIPYLDIINEILENSIVPGLNLNPEPSGRADIQKAVYRALAGAQNSFQQPFVLPLRRVEAYLGHFKRTRADVARALGVDAETYARARLGLSVAEQDLIATSRSNDSTFLRMLYGNDIAQSLTPSKAIDTQHFLKLTRWTRDDLGQLFVTRFVRGGSTITIQPEKSAPESIQNDIEVVRGLNLGVLDRLHRFTRLWRKLPSWSVAEMDQVLFQLKTGATPQLGQAHLAHIAALLDIQARFAIGVEELCALVAPFPKERFGEGRPLFDRLFNLEPFVTQDGPWSSDPPAGSPNQVFTHPSFAGGASQPSNRVLQRLLAGLQVSDQELVELIEGLRLLPGSSAALALTPQNLVLLYRHARLARLLKVPVKELLQLLELGRIGGTSAPFRVTDLTGLQAFLRFFDRRQTSGFSPDDLGFMTGGTVLKPSDYFDAATVAREVAESVQSERAVEFDDTVLTQLQRLTETQSRDFIQANSVNTSPAFERVLGSSQWRIKSNYDPKRALAVPASVTVDVNGIRELLSLLGEKDEYDDNLFARLPGITEQQSRDFIDANTAVNAPALEQVAGSGKWQLRSGYDPLSGVLAVPAQVNVDLSLVRTLLNGFLAPAAATEFSDTVLTQLPGVTEAQSREFVAANPLAFEKVPESNKWRLKKDFDPQRSRLSIPSSLIIDLQRVGELLDSFHPRGLLPGRIAAQLRLAEEKLNPLAILAGADLTTHDNDLAVELQPGGQPNKLEGIIQTLLPFTVLFRSSAWDEAALKFVNDNRSVFSLDKGLSTEAAFKVAAYVRLATVAEPDFTPEKPQPDAEAVRRVLKEGLTIPSSLAQTDKDAKLATIAKALRVPRSRIAALHPHLVFGSDPFDALDRLAHCLELADYLGVSGETLKVLVPSAPTPSTLAVASEYNALVDAAEGLYGVIRAKYPEERTFEAMIEAFEDAIRGLKRDGLVEFLIRSEEPRRFTSRSHLYQHLLIDLELEGCARTSRVVAATSSLQLYVHRVLMNLEQDTRPENDPNRVHVRPERIPAEWAWRKHYRVWEANRKVFLYPESYLEPELRDDKTPLFEELESTLLQQEIGEQSVTDAYASYLRGFMEVAGLKIAGAYNERATSRDTLHLLGVTPTDPPTYYYRRIENLYLSQGAGSNRPRLTATPWRKLDVQIPVPTASPIPYRGTMLIFWAEMNTRPRTIFTGGTSSEAGYVHTISLKFSRLLVDAHSD
jgi:hypothetical protein